MFNFNHLYYFYITGKTGGVTAAARALKTSQPSLSAQLKTLEESLDRKLFLKVGRNQVLSEEGQRVFTYCRKMFEIAEDLSSAMASDTPENVRLHIGVSDEIERPFVVEVVSKIARMKSRVPPMLTMTSGSSAQLISWLKSGSLDVIITNQPPYDEAISTLAQIDMPVMLAFQLGPEASEFQRLSLPKLMKNLQHGSTKWALPHQKLKIRSEIDLFMNKGRVGGRIVFESDVLSSVVRAVVDGLGLAFLPLPYIYTEVAQGKLGVRGPQGGFWKHGLWLLTSRRSVQTPLFNGLKNAFEQTATSSG